MSLRSLLAVLVLMGSVFAGCLGGGDDAPAPAATNESGGQLNTTAPDGRGNLVAFEETNMTEEGEGGVDHHHDYWNGASRLLMFETQAMMDPFPDTGGASVTFRPPQGTLVYEGTASVEFTITKPQRHVCEPLVTFGGRFMCTDYLVYREEYVPPVDEPNPPAGLEMRYKHASTTEWIDAGAISWDTPHAIKVTHPTQTDMPHATSSAWEFQVVSPNPQDFTLMFTAKAEVVRAEGEIPLWPGHPLFYTPDKMSRVVVDSVETYACDSGFSATGCVGVAGDTDLVTPDKLISYGTRTLFIWVNISEFNAPNPATAPTSWYVYHINVTGRENATRTVDAENYPIEGREFFWALPVDDGAMDSPYSDGSKWRFGLSASYVPPPNPLVGSCYDNCADWSAKYTITVIASAEELPASQYHMSCLQADDYCPPDEGGSGESDDDYAPAYTADELRARGLRL